jgi:hypothetical protein
MKKNIIDKLFRRCIFFLVIVTVLFFPQNKVNAGNFGGLALFSIPCTCSGTLWIWFTPLYYNSDITITGSLVYSPFSTTLFKEYSIGSPLTWHLGSYSTDVSSCLMYAVVGCFTLPSLGLMKDVATS